MSKAEKHYATDWPEVEAILRMSLVQRWHMIGSLPRQSLADHSTNVALLAYLIGRLAPNMYFGNPESCAVAGLLHDMEETFAGDMAPLMKQWFNRAVFDEIEAAILPSVFRDTMPPKSRTFEEHQRAAMVKICDLADAIRWVRLPTDAIQSHAFTDVSERYWQRVAEAARIWPRHVTATVLKVTHEYAYQTRVATSNGIRSADVLEAIDNLARGPGSESGSTGCVFRPAHWFPRDRVVRTESGEDYSNPGLTD